MRCLIVLKNDLLAVSNFQLIKQRERQIIINNSTCRFKISHLRYFEHLIRPHRSQRHSATCIMHSFCETSRQSASPFLYWSYPSAKLKIPKYDILKSRHHLSSTYCCNRQGAISCGRHHHITPCTCRLPLYREMMKQAFILHPLPQRSARTTRRRPRPICSRAERPPSTPLLTRLDALDARTQSIKCPFWRRRFSDTLDTIRQVALWALLTRHKSLPIPLALPESSTAKSPSLPIAKRAEMIKDDFIKRQYYITGRLTSEIYRDDCLFDGPDPDVPVRGLAKYTAATAGLFDRKVSRVDLIDITYDASCVYAEWRLEGALNLPWKPRIKPYTGTTTYEFDDNGLVCKHVETWSVTAFDAFVSVVWRGFGKPPADDIDKILEERGKSRVLKARHLI